MRCTGPRGQAQTVENKGAFLWQKFPKCVKYEGVMLLLSTSRTWSSSVSAMRSSVQSLRYLRSVTEQQFTIYHRIRRTWHAGDAIYRRWAECLPDRIQ